jgi:hypothetical protein
MPVPRWFSAGAVLDGKIFVVGGTDGRVDHSRVDRFDPVANTWDTVASLPRPLEAPGACTYEGHVYVVGGYSTYGSYSKRVFKFLPSTGLGRWVEVDSLRVPRTSLGVAVAGGRMYAVGGRYFNNLSTAEFYVQGNWHPERMPMSTSRSGLGVVGYGHIVAAIGGMGHGGRLSSVEILSTTAGEWWYGDPLPGNRAFLGAAYAGGKVVVIGGLESMNGVATVNTHVPWTGIQESEVEPIPVTGLPTVLSGPLRLERPVGYEVYDHTGSRVASGNGPGELRLARGVWFVRTTDGKVSATHKVTVVR